MMWNHWIKIDFFLVIQLQFIVYFKHFIVGLLMCHSLKENEIYVLTDNANLYLKLQRSLSNI